MLTVVRPDLSRLWNAVQRARERFQRRPTPVSGERLIRAQFEFNCAFTNDREQAEALAEEMRVTIESLLSKTA